MANILTSLIPTLYLSLDTVSRSTAGFISAVTVDSSTIGAALNETVRIPLTMKEDQLFDIVDSDYAPDNGDHEIKYVDAAITKSKMVPIRWNGEQERAVGNTGMFNQILGDQITQAMEMLVQEVESDIAATYVGASRAIGTAGTTPFADDSIAPVAQLRRALIDNGTPTSDLQLVLNTYTGAILRNVGNLVKADENASDATLRRGELLDIFGFRVRESRWADNHTAGSITGTPLVNKSGGYSVGATSIVFDGTTNVAVKAGDLVSFGSDPTQYVVAADCTASPLVIAEPGLVAPVANDAAITLGSGYAVNMAFARSAIHLFTRFPADPPGGDSASETTTLTDPHSGLSFQCKLYRGYRRFKLEIGLAWGVKLIKPEHCVLLLG